MKHEIIGIDHGYGLIKTRSTEFTTALTRFSSEPAITKNTVEYKGNYYVVGGGQRLNVKTSKTEDGDNFILTLAALAEELKNRGLNECEVTISAGLPLTRFGAQKESFKEYLLQERDIYFKYETEPYHVVISGVILSPQGYAAIIEDLDTLPEDNTLVVDLGSWTMDILPMDGTVPDMTSTASLNEGVITAFNKINEEIRRLFGNDIPESIIQKVMQNKAVTLPDKYLVVIKELLKEYARNIQTKIEELKFNTEITSIIFVGGGASIIKNYGMSYFKNARIKCDVHANAKGYEYIAKEMLNNAA